MRSFLPGSLGPRYQRIPVVYQAQTLFLGVTEWGCVGQPVIFCVHGFFEHAESFYAVAEHLADRYHVIALDLPGRGRSDSLPGVTDRFIACLACVRAAWQVMGLTEPMVLMGTSLGGLLAYVLAARYPGYCRAVIVNDAPPEASWRVWRTFRPSWTRAWSLLTGMCGRDPRPYVCHPAVRDYRRRYAATWLRTDFPFVHFDVRLLGVLGSVLSCRRDPIDLWFFFRRIRVPLLVFHAELSWLMSSALARAMSVAQPRRLRVVTVLGACHPVGLCTPAEWKEIDHFLGQLPAVSAEAVVLSPGFVHDNSNTVR